MLVQEQLRRLGLRSLSSCISDAMILSRALLLAEVNAMRIAGSTCVSMAAPVYLGLFSRIGVQTE